MIPPINKPAFFMGLKGAILDNNKQEFYYLLKPRVKDVIRKAFKKVIQEKDVTCYIDGLHYISYSTGKWYRILSLEPPFENTLLSALENDYYKERQRFVASRGLNLYTDDDLVERLHIAFKGDQNVEKVPGWIDCEVSSSWVREFQRLSREANLIDFALSSDIEFCQKMRDARESLPLKQVTHCFGANRPDLRPFLKFIDSFSTALLGDKTKQPKFSRWRTEQINDLIAKRSKLLKEHLNDVHKSLKSGTAWKLFARRLWAFRLLTFSFYSTLHLKFNFTTDKNLYVLIDPFYWPEQMCQNEASLTKTHGDNTNIGLRYMAFGAAYSAKSPLSNQDIDDISNKLLLQMKEILSAELYYGLSQGGGNVVLAEDTIRQCTILSKEVLDEVNLYKALIKNTWLKNSGDGTKRNVYKGFVGRSSKIIQMIEKIKRLVEEPAFNKGEEDGVRIELPQGRCIFLHSLPGSGKEGLAELIHLMSCRNINNEDNLRLLVDHFSKSKHIDLLDDYKPAFAYELGLEEKDLDTTLSELKRHVHDETTRSAVIEKFLKKTGRDETFNYRTQHCGELIDSKRFTDVLLGSKELEQQGWIGLIPIVHALGGTLFLDEFNTLGLHMSSRFLRMFDKPYEIEMPWDPKRYRLNVNLLTVFASNLSPAELVDKGFNPAVIGRICQYVFEIPPLRERKEDIAVFVNHHLQKRREDDEGDGILKGLTRIDLDALRLICELPWLDNYRGIKGLLDHIVLERKCRRDDTSRITFVEVIKAISKRELLLSRTEEENLKAAFKSPA